MLSTVVRILFYIAVTAFPVLKFYHHKMATPGGSWENELAAALPKIELHLHLDGSLSPEFIARRAAIRGMALPVPASELRRWLHQMKEEGTKADGKLTSTATSKNWPVFDFCNQFLQTEEELTEATADLLGRLSAAPNNVVYAEIRFCPELHAREGLTAEQAVAAVIKGFRTHALESGMKGGVVIAALRSLSPDHGVQMAELADKFLQRKPEDPIGVVGFDVAGDEGSFPLRSPSDSMWAGATRARDLGVPVTVHAGEWPEKYGTVDNVRFAFEQLGVRRIGHGIALRSDPDLMDAIKRAGNVTVEVCLTSNVGRGFKVASYEVHPAAKFYDRGLPFSLSSDNLLLSGEKDLQPSPYHEVLMLAQRVIPKSDEDPYIGWRAVEFSLKSGIRAAFSPAVDKAFVEGFDRKVDDVIGKYIS